MSETHHLTTEEELNIAVETGRVRRQTERRAASVRYDARNDAVEIELTDGVAVRSPRKMIAELRDIPGADMGELRVSPVGYGIKLDSYNVGISVHGLIAALAAPGDMAASLGRLGGAARSERKRESARANGAKGGRPRKVVHAA